MNENSEMIVILFFSFRYAFRFGYQILPSINYMDSQRHFLASVLFYDAYLAYALDYFSLPHHMRCILIIRRSPYFLNKTNYHRSWSFIVKSPQRYLSKRSGDESDAPPRGLMDRYDRFLARRFPRFHRVHRLVIDGIFLSCFYLRKCLRILKKFE